jgi:hypothetical protein
MRQRGIPALLAGDQAPIRDFDMLAISLPMSSCSPTPLNLIDLAGMPVRSLDRDASYPLVIAGGHACYNPEPMAPFIDVFVIGEGEEAMLKIIGTMRAAAHLDRETQLRHMAGIEGCYVPRFYDVRLPPRRHDRRHHAHRSRSARQGAEDHHARPAAAGDRFHRALHRDGPQPRAHRDYARLHPGLPLLPRRAWSPGPCANGRSRRSPGGDGQILSKTGYEEIALLSLSSSDYTNVLELTEKIGQRFGHLG